MKFKNQTELKLLEPLGDGLTSQVYRAIRKHNRWGVEQTVAVKILKSHNQVQALKNEMQVLSKVESLHCVRWLGWADLEMGPAILLEYLDGVSLYELCAHSALEERLVAEIVAQIQIGLRDLHGHGVVHGDLSPKNIFVTNKGVVKILDFGFSTKEERPQIFGTPQFLSTEGWENRPLTTFSDLFSLGLLREDLLGGTVLMSAGARSWRQRALDLQDRNSLLVANATQRQFLDIKSNEKQKKDLAELVVRVQTLKKTTASTTQLLFSAPQKKKNSVQPLSGFLFFLVFLFFHNLQPANQSLTAMPSSTAYYTLDVRSGHWARIWLVKAGDQKSTKRSEIYTPFRFRQIPKGDYELHWESKGETGKIFVQLSKSRRILIK